MRKNIVVAGSVAALVLFAGLGLAKDKEPDGKTLFREYCKPCHTEDSDHGEYTPMTLIQEQWERFFDSKLQPTHQGVEAPGAEGKKLLEVLTPEMIKKIREFAVDHAADSEHPMTCG